MRARIFFGLLAMLSAANASASSFNLDPWILVFEPHKKIISHLVTFNFQSDAPSQNDGVLRPDPGKGSGAPVPVEITLAAREIGIDGSVNYPSAKGADDFVVYPSQFILYPGDSKKVQVQWVGTAPPVKETSLGFIATQLPLQLKREKEQPKSAIARVSVETRYEGIIVVRPDGARPDVVV